MSRRITVIRGTGETLTFDGWISGSLGGASTITDHPVEDGSTISDHSQHDPRSVTLQVSQSESPIDDDGGPFGEARVQAAIEFLEAIGRSGEPVDVEIPRVGLLTDYVLARWPAEIDVRKSAAFEVVFREIEIAGVEIVQVPIEAIAPPARAGHQPEEDLGNQPTDEVDAEQVEKQAPPPSILATLFG